MKKVILFAFSLVVTIQVIAGIVLLIQSNQNNRLIELQEKALVNYCESKPHAIECGIWAMVTREQYAYETANCYHFAYEIDKSLLQSEMVTLFDFCANGLIPFPPDK